MTGHFVALGILNRADGIRAISTVFLLISLIVLKPGSVWSMEPAPQPMSLAFEDQFETKRQLQDLRGKVAVLVYADRTGVDVGREYGESLHLLFHPTAKGLAPGKARQEPSAPLPGAKPGQAVPGVAVVPVACVGKVPELVRTLIRGRIKAASPEVPVWLDFDEEMVKKFGLTTGQVNVAVFDSQGRYRYGFTGTPDSKRKEELVRVIQTLRGEGK